METEIEKIDKDSEAFPNCLRDMPSAPKVLYFRGKLPANDEKRVAMVGSRVCSDYGRRAGADIAQGLVDAGFTIVSGLTQGVDTIGHTAAVESGRRTIAVLGTGIDRASLYPQSNLDLSEKIVNNGGCLLSEYPPGMHGAKYTFPQRNRIVAALSKAVVVIEAKIKSGSLITARWAQKMGKPVFALPGSIYALNSGGCNDLIRQGAILIRNASDILEALGHAVTPSQQKTLFGATPEENLILEALSEEALEMDKIITKTTLPPQTVLSIIPVLEIKGLVKNIGGMKY
jgi:DNA processing protein